jgi:F-type H+-transporting ATPase subunit delta
MAQTIVARYARALVDLATKPSPEITGERAAAELRAFEGVWEQSAELRNILLSPAVSAARKRAVVGALAGNLGISRIVRNFLYVVIDHRRIAEVAAMRAAFEEMLDERLGIVRVHVTSAREMTEAQRDAMGTELARATGRKVRLQHAVDPQLIGGAVARIGSTTYDGSVRGQLDDLKRRLAE